MTKRKDILALNIVAYIVILLVTIICLVPFLIILSGSFSSEHAVIASGFSIFPREFSLQAYQTVFQQPGVIVRSYITTIGITLVGTAFGLFMTAMTAYVLQRKDFEWRNRFSFFFYFTTLFSGGLVPFYILMIQYLHLKNSYAALILPLCFSVFNLLLMKSFMSGIPMELTEAARIDGCGDFSIFLKIILPLSKASLATIGLFMALAYWNDWYNPMLYIDDEKMYTLQYFLYQKVSSIEAYKQIISQQGGSSAANMISMPTQTLKMALTIVVTGPIILAYPIVQKYFVQGITIGAVKG